MKIKLFDKQKKDRNHVLYITIDEYPTKRIKDESVVFSFSDDDLIVESSIDDEKKRLSVQETIKLLGMSEDKLRDLVDKSRSFGLWGYLDEKD